MTNISTRSLEVSGIGTVEVTYADQGTGRNFLLLHGGAGPVSVSSFADLLSSNRAARVLTPTHPGFLGTPRSDALHDVKGLAVLYVRLIEDLELSDVTVIGNSIGGWIAAEVAVLNSPRVSAVVIVDAVGIDVDGHPVADVSTKTFPEIQSLSYFEPEKFRIDPTAFSDAQRAMMANNFATLSLYAGGSSMVDPTLRSRLGTIRVPVMVIWGESDGIADVEYGRAYAAAVKGAEFVVMDKAGHLPQLEAPDRLLPLVFNFAASHLPSHGDGRTSGAEAETSAEGLV
jgi:pimeloyl-ACP methyl ester carboxylesterase